MTVLIFNGLRQSPQIRGKSDGVKKVGVDIHQDAELGEGQLGPCLRGFVNSQEGIDEIPYSS